MKTAKEIIEKNIPSAYNIWPGNAELIKCMEEYADQFKQPSSEPILIPFDLAKAVGGAKLITRDKTEIVKFGLVQLPLPNATHYAIMKDGAFITVNGYGKHWSNDLLDLFLLAETKTMWVNVQNGGLAYYFETKDEADSNKDNDTIMTTTIIIPIK